MLATTTKTIIVLFNYVLVLLGVIFVTQSAVAKQPINNAASLSASFVIPSSSSFKRRQCGQATHRIAHGLSFDVSTRRKGTSITTRTLTTTTKALYMSASARRRNSSDDNQANISNAKKQFVTSWGEPIRAYEVLKLKRDCTSRDIKASYYTLMKKYHPDRVAQKNGILPGSCNNMLEVTQMYERIKLSYEILKDSTQRIRYDRAEALENPKAAMERAAWNAVGWGVSSVGKGLGDLSKGMWNMSTKAAQDFITSNQEKQKQQQAAKKQQRHDPTPITDDNVIRKTIHIDHMENEPTTIPRLDNKDLSLMSMDGGGSTSLSFFNDLFKTQSTTTATAASTTITANAVTSTTIAAETTTTIENGSSVATADTSSTTEIVVDNNNHNNVVAAADVDGSTALRSDDTSNRTTTKAVKGNSATKKKKGKQSKSSKQTKKTTTKTKGSKS